MAALIGAREGTRSYINVGCHKGLCKARFLWLDAEDVPVVELSHTPEGVVVEGDHVVGGHLCLIHGAV